MSVWETCVRTRLSHNSETVADRRRSSAKIEPPLYTVNEFEAPFTGPEFPCRVLLDSPLHAV